MTDREMDRFYNGFIRAQYMTDAQIETELREAAEKQRHRNEQILTAEPAKQYCLILEDIAYMMASEEMVLGQETPTPEEITKRAIEGLMADALFHARAEMYTRYVAGLLRAGAPWQVHSAEEQ